MACQLHGAIRQHLHPLIAAERFEILEIKLKAARLCSQWPNGHRGDKLTDLVAVGVFPVGREPHNFAFVAVLAVADELANHRVHTAQRMWQENALENFDFVSLTTGHHRGNEIPGTVIAETRG